MTHTPLHALIFGAALLILPLSAEAACLVEYKAKKDDPLRLDQGTVTLPSCGSAGAVESAVRAQLASQGWTLLKIVRTSEN